MREFFKLVETDPATLEKLTGMKLPLGLKGKDGQMLLVFNQFVRAIKGDDRAVTEIFNRMDGSPKGSLQIEAGSVVDLIREAQRKAKEANNGI